MEWLLTSNHFDRWLKAGHQDFYHMIGKRIHLNDALEESLNRLNQLKAKVNIINDRIKGKVNEQLIKAFLEVFDRKSLALFLYQSFNKELENIVRYNGTFPENVRDLIIKARDDGWLKELVKKVKDYSPNFKF